MRKHLGYFYRTKGHKRHAHPGNLSLFQGLRPMSLPHEGRSALHDRDENAAINIEREGLRILREPEVFAGVTP